MRRNVRIKSGLTQIASDPTRRRSDAIVYICLTCVFFFSVGCAAPGRGQGWIEGALWVENCKDGHPLDTESFDLRADTFFGDPLFDTTDSVAQRQSTLLLRIQETAGNIEDANLAVLQFHDTVRAAQAFAAAEPLPITDNSYCEDCVDVNPAVRFTINLFNSCPSNRSPLIGAPLALEEKETSGDYRDRVCLLPGDDAPPACPTLNDDQRRQLDDICKLDDFFDRSQRETIEQILGPSGSCLYLCHFGRAERGAAYEDLWGFEVEYGDEVSALFSTEIIDTRSFSLTRCAGAFGHVTGMFRFRLVRNRIAQPFP